MLKEAIPPAFCFLCQRFTADAPCFRKMRAISQVKPISDYAADKSLAAAANAAWPADNWWRAYGDPQLATLITEGLTGASDMRIAAARVSMAYAGVGASQASLLPTVGASAKADSERQSYNYLIGKDFVPLGWKDAGMGTLSFDWEIDFWGKNRGGAGRRQRQRCRRRGRGRRHAPCPFYRHCRRLRPPRRALCRP